MGLFPGQGQMGKVSLSEGKPVDDLLTFELKDGDELFVHADPKGLRRLSDMLQKLAAAVEAGDFPHEHLFTSEWGGNDLSSKPQEQGHLCLHHVKIYGWPDIRGALPYSEKPGGG